MTTPRTVDHSPKGLLQPVGGRQHILHRVLRLHNTILRWTRYLARRRQQTEYSHPNIHWARAPPPGPRLLIKFGYAGIPTGLTVLEVITKLRLCLRSLLAKGAPVIRYAETGILRLFQPPNPKPVLSLRTDTLHVDLPHSVLRSWQPILSTKRDLACNPVGVATACKAEATWYAHLRFALAEP